MIRTGKVLNLQKIKKTGFFGMNKTILIMCFIFITGFIISAVTFKSGLVINFKSLFKYLYLKRVGAAFFKVLIKSFMIYVTVTAFYFLFGASVMGVVTVPFLTLFLGYLFGGISSYIYSEYGLKGIAFNALLIIPPSILFLVSCFFAAKSSLTFSLSLSKLTLTRTAPANLYFPFKEYCSNYIIYLIIIAISAIADTTLSVLFIKLFDF